MLQSTDIAVAGQKMHWLIGKQRLDTMQGMITAFPITELLNAIRIKAFLRHLSAFGQLRYRATTPMPTTPEMTAAAIDHLARSLPGSLWAPWALPFQLSGMRSSTLHQVLSCAVLIRRNQDPVVHSPTLLGTVTTAAPMTVLTAKLERHPRWEDMASAIYRLRDYLTSHRCPIDYRQRRRLDYSELLPERAGGKSVSIRPPEPGSAAKLMSPAVGFSNDSAVRQLEPPHSYRQRQITVISAKRLTTSRCCLHLRCLNVSSPRRCRC